MLFVAVGASSVARARAVDAVDVRGLLPVQKQALEAVRRAVAAGLVDVTSAATDRTEINRAARLIRGLPPRRARPVGVALWQVAALSGRLSGPRAVALFGQLRVNDDYFALHGPPAAATDITDTDGVVYRYFVGRCFEFHPLANFGALNAAVAAGDAVATKRLADALVARGVHPPWGGVVWEYYFPFGGGSPPWVSGMVQAVAAQALARAAGLVTEETSALVGQAHAAYQAIPGRLLTRVAAGPWIRLYSFQNVAVLNAQLQSVISLSSYAAATRDTAAAALAARMEHSAAAMLPRFDTGYWTYYSLASDPSPLGYQQYVVQLLTRLGPDDPRFADAATRFASYQHQPPAFKLASAGLGQLRFWLSKPASVRADSAAGPTKAVSLTGGWHTLAWKEPARPGIYPVHLAAVDWAGNRASLEALPIVRATTTTASAGSAAHRSVAATATGQTGFLVGAGLDDPSQAPLAQTLGLWGVRIGIAWPAGATAPDPGLVSTLQRLPATLTVVAELNASTLPADDASRAALATYTTSLTQQVTNLRQIVLAPAPTPATTAAYAAAFTALRQAVQATAPNVTVALAIDGSLAPKTTIAALATALTGTAPPLVAFRPAAQPATGAWTTANVAQLTSALAQAFNGTAPPVLLDGVTASTPSTYTAAIAAAACTPSLSGLIIDRLVDNPAIPGVTTGLFDTTGHPKTGAATIAAAATSAQRGLIVCPGLATPAAASSITFPTDLTTTAATTIQLGCLRDCLYLVTLDNANGLPVVAARGALTGGTPPTTVTLPKAKLTPGTYHLNVRLINQVNPGTLLRLQSPPLTTSQ